MIPYKHGGWLSMVLRVHGSVVKHVWPRLLFVTIVSIVFTYLQRTDPRFRFSLTVTPFLITALPLGIILGFRNTSSYERFWDGRRLWGSLVNGTRSLTRQIAAYIVARDEADESEVIAFRKKTSYRVIAFAHALRLHLRGDKNLSALAPFLDEDEVKELAKEPSPPAAIVHRLGLCLQEAEKRGWLHNRHTLLLEASLVGLTDVLGGCERIKNTPTPISYIVFIHRAVAIYCLLLPFGVAETVHNLTPLVVFFVSYALFSLDAIGDEIDDPFRLTDNALPLNHLARNIEIYIRRRLGETELPKPLQPVKGVLM